MRSILSVLSYSFSTVPFLLAAVLAGDPSTTARTVVLHDMDIIPLYAQNGYVTEIHFPKGVQPMELRVGKPAFFRCNVSGNTLYIEPQDYRMSVEERGRP
jgi:hypothetical protein